jgi:hypothetical protein
MPEAPDAVPRPPTLASERIGGTDREAIDEIDRVGMGFISKIHRERMDGIGRRPIDPVGGDVGDERRDGVVDEIGGGPASRIDEIWSLSKLAKMPP